MRADVTGREPEAGGTECPRPPSRRRGESSEERLGAGEPSQTASSCPSGPAPPSGPQPRHSGTLLCSPRPKPLCSPFCTVHPSQPALVHHVGTRAPFQKFLQTFRSTNTMSSCEGHGARRPGGEDAGCALRRLESSWAADITGHPQSTQPRAVCGGAERVAVIAPWGSQMRKMKKASGSNGPASSPGPPITVL